MHEFDQPRHVSRRVVTVEVNVPNEAIVVAAGPGNVHAMESAAASAVRRIEVLTMRPHVGKTPPRCP